MYCLISPLLCNVAIEMLAIAVRSNRMIQGVTCLTFESKLSLYADDMVLFLQNQEMCLQLLNMILDQYSKVSGYKIIERKSVNFGLNITERVKQCAKQHSLQEGVKL